MLFILFLFLRHFYDAAVWRFFAIPFTIE